VKCFIGLGSSLGDRLSTLERAGAALKNLSGAKHLRVSNVYETPALLPPDAPPDWDIPYLNAAAEMDWQGSLRDLLAALKKTEHDLGRAPAGRWAPRAIDLDILLAEDATCAEDGLKVPHPGLTSRAFALGPLRDLAPEIKIPGVGKTALEALRALPGGAPVWMGILNLTPDSFSDGGALQTPEAVDETARTYERAGAWMLDLGAESTRPGAAVLTAQEEWLRLAPALEVLNARFSNRLFRPRLSIDTHRAATAEKALKEGADCINDVSGGADARMAPLIREAGCDYVLMHSLSVPADKNKTLPENRDAALEVRDWARKKIDTSGLDPARIILDPGLGFGKTARQSLDLLRNFEIFRDLGVRLLCGHSRKSFITRWTSAPPPERDTESVAVSLRMAERGADILRVHAPEKHIRAWRAFQGC
jgi:2-amino-4-hydroxy-6-hydroxymethyldihydropteridine diphosphokinase/dihydropteroate synthase